MRSNDTVRTASGTTRRRVITILGAAAGLSLSGVSWSRPARAGVNLYTWQGTTLGADSTITLAHTSREGADAVFNMVVAELNRLEAIFSLHRDDSEISRLNRDGRVNRPSADMLALLSEARHYSEISDGAFDITVQPLWNLYADHFSRYPDDEKGPLAAQVTAARALVDYRRIETNPLYVKLDRKGMGITLNSIGQGYITDRVADLLKANGIEHVLVSLGETRALGDHPEGRPWVVGLKDPRNPERIERSIDLVDMAVATSGGYGTVFDRAGRFNHLFDPKTGASADAHIGVSVIAPRATEANGLSTALYVAPVKQAESILKRASKKATAIVTTPDGVTRTLTA